MRKQLALAFMVDLARFAANTEVVFRSLEEGWFEGVVVQTNVEIYDEDGETAIIPYVVRLSDNEEESRGKVGVSGFMRVFVDSDSYIMEGNFVNKFPKLRFRVGDEVLCSMEEGWKRAVVVSFWEMDKHGRRNPYQARLQGYHGNGEIYAPYDDDEIVRLFDGSLSDAIMARLLREEEEEKNALEKKKLAKKKKKTNKKKKKRDSLSSESSEQGETRETEIAPKNSELKTPQLPQMLAKLKLNSEEELVCPISLMPFIDPVVASDGHVYEKAHIEAWISRCISESVFEEPTSPLTGEVINRDVYKIHLIKKMVRSS